MFWNYLDIFFSFFRYAFVFQSILLVSMVATVCTRVLRNNSKTTFIRVVDYHFKPLWANNNSYRAWGCPHLNAYLYTTVKQLLFINRIDCRRAGVCIEEVTVWHAPLIGFLLVILIRLFSSESFDLLPVLFFGTHVWQFSPLNHRSVAILISWI